MESKTRQNRTGADRRRETLKTIESLVCADRQNAHGDAEDNFEDIAAKWTITARCRGLLRPDAKFLAEDVALFMVDFKTCRAAHKIDNEENWLDLGGYSTCGHGIIKKKAELLRGVAHGACQGDSQAQRQGA